MEPSNQELQKNRKRFPKWGRWLIGIIGAVILVGVGWWVASSKYKAENQKLKNQLSSPSTTSSTTLSSTTSTTSSAVDPTAGWKTYSNQNQKISFKYPATWSIEKDNLGADNSGSGQYLDKYVTVKNNSVETLTLVLEHEGAARGFEGVSKFIDYMSTKIEGNAVVLGSKKREEPPGESGGGYAIIATTDNQFNGNNIGIWLEGQDENDIQQGISLFKTIVGTITVGK